VDSSDLSREDRGSTSLWHSQPNAGTLGRP
jgi:hypothetical protein